MDRIVVFLNGGRGIALVAALHQAGHGIDAVVLPAGRADVLGPDIAAIGVKVWPVENVNEDAFVQKLRAAAPKLVIVAGFSTILGQAILSVPVHGAINLHAGRLPAYRGGSPLNWQVINGEADIGVSVLRVDEGIDTGDILAVGAFDLGPGADIAEVHEQANALFPKLVLQVLQRFDGGNFAGEMQRPDVDGYWHQRNEADGRLHWDRLSMHEAYNLVRAITRPYPGAFCYLGDQTVRVLAATVPEMRIHGVPGRVCHVQGRGPYVICRDFGILLREYQIEGQPGRRLPHGVHLS
jgi:methionyl-tRNA formyltransferase